MREYWVCKVGKSLDILVEDLAGPFPTYQLAWAWIVNNGGSDKLRATVVRRK
jgi:hypothetical protein